MVREAIPAEIKSLQDFADVAREVAASGRARTVLVDGDEPVLIAPARSRRRRDSGFTPEQWEAVMASVGGWEGLVDPDQLERDLDAARSDDRRPVEL